MSSMFGYTGTILLILVLGSLAWYTAFWPLGLFVTGEHAGASAARAVVDQ